MSCIRRDDRVRLYENGFIVLPKLLAGNEARQLTAEVERLCCQEVDNEQTRRSKEGAVLVMTNVERQSDYIFDMARHSSFLDMVGFLMEAEVVPVNVELFVKPPRTGVMTPPHQDHAFYRNAPERPTLTVWIALDDATADSGALQYAKGQWNFTLPHRRSDLDHFALELSDANALTFRMAEVPRGGCVVHHSFAIHKSGPNTTDEPRRAIAFAYRATS